MEKEVQEIHYKLDDNGNIVIGKIVPRDWCRRLAQQTKKSRQSIYALANKLGRIPTVMEILDQRPGRPPKFKR